MELVLLVLAFIVFALLVREFKKGKKVYARSTNTDPNASIVQRSTLAKFGLGFRRKTQRVLVLEKPKLDLTPESRYALHLLENTRQGVFLTGKAGTGKSTLLKYFRATTKKNVAVVAPTGVAAINVQGQTIHRFFKFKPDITVETVKQYVSREQAMLYKKLDVLVIDEISMVRPDWVDCINAFLQLHGPRPGELFGGVQLVFIGDLYQLPPVVKREEEHIFQSFYNSEFFFSAKSLQSYQFAPIELTKVYRQSDAEFIEALNAVREGEVEHRHLDLLNSRVDTTVTTESASEALRIWLMPKKTQVAEVNSKHMERLPGKGRVYEGEVEGGFGVDEMPTSFELHLKEGAQVMLLNNDPGGKWVNGDVAKVVGLGRNGVRVLFEDGSYDDIGLHTWDAFRHTLDASTGKIVAVSDGSYTQLPLKPAWALTIHKSQGKTYDKVVIDFSEGVHHSGQAYVALSRCRSLEGLTLTAPIRRSHIFIHPLVKQFMTLASQRSRELVPK